MERGNDAVFGVFVVAADGGMKIEADEDGEEKDGEDLGDGAVGAGLDLEEG